MTAQPTLGALSLLSPDSRSTPRHAAVPLPMSAHQSPQVVPHTHVRVATCLHAFVCVLACSTARKQSPSASVEH